MRHRITVHQQITTLHIVALLNTDVLALWNQTLGRLFALCIWNDNHAALGLVVLAKFERDRRFRS